MSHADQPPIDLRLLAYSNSSLAQTGYGVQVKHLATIAKRLGITFAEFGFYGAEGGLQERDGHPIYPKAYTPWGDDVAAAHGSHFHADLILALLDSWVINTDLFAQSRLILYVPIDHDPCPREIAERLRSCWLPVMYSQYAVRKAAELGIQTAYAPHCIDADVFQPAPRAEARASLGWPQDRPILVTVAANKGYPSRKNWPQMIRAFASAKQRHPDLLWYCHTTTGERGEMQGINLVAEAERYGVRDAIMFPNQHQLLLGYPDHYLRAVYAAGDLFYLPSAGEGFGVPCFPAGTLINTPKGVTPIESLSVGDDVITHAGNIQTVTETMNRPVIGEPGVVIQARGNTMKPLSATANHPVYAVKRNGRSWGQVRNAIASGETPDWIAAGDLAVDDFLVLPRVKLQGESGTLDLRPLAGIKGDNLRSATSNTGSRGVTSRDIARTAGVSLKAAQRVLGAYELDSVSTKNREHIMATAQAAGWKPLAAISPDMPLCWDTGFFIGQYLAEGSVGATGSIEFASHANEVEIRANLTRIAYEQWGLEAQEHIKDNCGRLFVTNRNLSRAIVSMCGSGSHVKHLPSSAFANEEFARGILAGMWMGDGNLSNGTSTYTTASPSLAHGIRMLMTAFGIASTIRNDGKGCYSVGVNGAYAAVFKPLFNMFSNIPAQKDQVNRFFLMPTEYGWLCPITSIERTRLTTVVYNLEVNGDHSYCAEGFAVHNCWESMACGTPVLTTDVTAMQDITAAGVPGFYLPEEACERWMTPLVADQFVPRHYELARLLDTALDTLSRLSDTERWERYGASARAFAEGYHVPVVADHYWRPIFAHAAQRIVEEGRVQFAGIAQHQRDINHAATLPNAGDRYAWWLNRWSDIQTHLPTLYALSRGMVVELGARSGVSTSALVAGVEARGGMVYSIDVDPNCESLFCSPQWFFLCGRSTSQTTVGRLITHVNADGPFIDLLFVDTEHTRAQVEAELAAWGPWVRSGGVIAFHDVDSYPDVREAVETFCQAHGLTPVYHAGSNGLGIVRIPEQGTQTGTLSTQGVKRGKR